MPHNYRVTNVDGCSDVRKGYHGRERAYSTSSSDSDYHSSTSDSNSESSRDVPQSRSDQPPHSRKVLMRAWLVRNVEENNIPGLEWLDKNKTIIRIPWKHGSRHDWEMNEDCGLFKMWALHTNKFQEGKVKACPKKWKANFRCALNSLPDVEEIKDQGMTKGNTACKVYRLLQPKIRRKQGSVARKNSAKKQKYSRAEKKKASAESEDRKYVHNLIADISSHPQHPCETGHVPYPDSAHGPDSSETDSAQEFDCPPSPMDSSSDNSFNDHPYAIRPSQMYKSNIPTMVEMESCAPEVAAARVKPEVPSIVDRQPSCFGLTSNVHSSIGEDTSDISDNFITTMLVDWENEAGGRSIPNSTAFINNNPIYQDGSSDNFLDEENKIIGDQNGWTTNQPLTWTSL